MMPAILVDTTSRTVTKGGSEVLLTEYEYRLVERLAASVGKPVRKRELVLAVWPEYERVLGDKGPPDAAMNNGVENLVWRVRKKIEPDATRPRYLRAQRRFGYRLLASGDEAKSSTSQAQASPLQDLWELAHPTEHLYPVPAASVRFPGFSMRDLGEHPATIQWQYHLGSELCLVLRPGRAGHLLLLDEGPDGTVYCLCPSQFAPRTLLGEEIVTLPQPESKFAAFRVSGSPGLEQLLAVISDEPLPLDWFPDDPSVAARKLSVADLNLLRATLAALPPGSWDVWSSHFEVIR